MTDRVRKHRHWFHQLEHLPGSFYAVNAEIRNHYRQKNNQCDRQYPGESGCKLYTIQFFFPVSAAQQELVHAFCSFYCVRAG